MPLDPRSFGPNQNIWSSLKAMSENNLGPFPVTGAPTNGTSGTYAGFANVGARLIDYTNGITYMNTGTKASPVWTRTAGKSVFQQLTGTIPAADITATTAGKFSHAAGQEIVPAQGAGTIIELVSVEMFYDFATAAYTGGGNITVNYSGGAAITGLVSAANSVGAAGDKPVIFYPLTAAALAALVNTGLSFVSSAAFTQPGTAAGVIRWVANYRVHATGL